MVLGGTGAGGIRPQRTGDEGASDKLRRLNVLDSLF